MSQIKLNSDVSIDLANLIDSRLLVQANSGGGKSWLLRRILEQSHGKVQQIVIDLEGEFSTLREKYDYVLAGKGGDTPADPRSAGLLARKLLELNVSAIIDLYELHHADRKRFVRLFLESMINAPKELWHPCMVVIDEAHVFVPEKGESEAAEAVIDLATRGRKRGFCAVLATQRLSKLHKDAAAECNNKLVGRTGLDIDMKRASEELGFTSREQYLSLRSLAPGEFFAFGPAISTEVARVTIGSVSTSHPKAGSRSLTKTVPPTDRIKRVLGKLADLPQEAQKEAQTMSELQSEIRELRRHKCATVNDETKSLHAVNEALKKAHDFYVREIEKERESWHRLVKFHEDAHLKAVQLFAGSKHPEVYIANLGKPKYEVGGVVTKKTGNIIDGFNLKEVSVIKPIGEVSHDPLSGAEKKILNAIAWFESIGINEPEQTAVAFLAGYTYRAGGFNNPRSRLRVRGFVEYLGDRIALTDTGREQVEAPSTAPSSDELHKKVLSVLPNPEGKLLQVLIDSYPEELSMEELAERTGYKYGSGGFNNPRSRLRSLGLIEYLPMGRVKAKSLLFIE